MEKALLSGRLLPARAALKGCTRLVAGSEYCQNRLPDLKTLAALRRHAPVTLATSILTDEGLAAVSALIAAAFRRGLMDEVIVNDWGLLEPLKKLRGLALSAGRLLCVELSATEPGWTEKFLREYGITAAETDDKKMAARLKALGLKVSWHAPHAFKAVTTYCPFERHFKAKCGFACEGRVLQLKNPHLKAPLLLTEKVYLTPGGSARPPAGVWRVVRREGF
ncbi:MAG: hypothetical protein NDI60_04395 [Elusimicrobiales bacterium]|nr:hypothetical protein [Elusimicrobiales bacterium]